MSPEAGSIVVAAQEVLSSLARPVAAEPTPPPMWEKWEIRLASKTATQLRREFPQKPRIKVINELLIGMLQERKAREALNLNHWPEYGPRFLERLAEQWKLEESERLAAMAGPLKAARKEMFNLALAITGNLVDAESALAESDFEYLTGAADQRSYAISVKRNAQDIVRAREGGQASDLPLERVLEIGDDAAGPEDESEGVAKTASRSEAAIADGKDPLQVLLDRKARHLKRSNLSRAKKRLATRRKHKDWRRKKWTAGLGIGRKTVADLPR